MVHCFERLLGKKLTIQMIGQPASIHTTAKYERDRKKKGGKKYSVNKKILKPNAMIG